MNKNKTFGVIGVCGANGNLIARILKQRGYNVIGTDITFKKDCRFAKALEGYDIDVFYGKTPESFFKKADYIIPPASMSKDSEMLKNCGKPILELQDVIDMIQPE
jgi:UDP-N-acetylmuramate--alanine ligase